MYGVSKWKGFQSMFVYSEKLAGKEVTTIEGLSQRQKMSMPMRLQKRVQFSAGIASLGWLFRHKDY